MSCTMFLVRKLADRQVDTFSLPAGSTSSSLVYLQDKLSSHQFLVDSRASASVFPAPASSSASIVKLLTADGSSVMCSGSRIFPQSFGSCSFDWMFNWLPYLFQYLGQIFSAIKIFCWMWPIRRFSVTSLRVFLPFCYPPPR